MKFYVFCLLVFSAATGFSLEAKDSSWPCGVVNFEQCSKESKYGHQEIEKMQETEKKIQALLEDKGSAIKEIETKLNDPEFLDSLSPAAENELKEKHGSLAEEYQMYQNQLMQMMQQTGFQSYQTLLSHIQKAARVVEKEKNIPFLIRKEACISFPASADVTHLIIQAMDKEFDSQSQGKKKEMTPK